MWLATDGETLRKNLGRSRPGDIAGGTLAGKEQDQVQSALDNELKIGIMEIVFALRPALTALPKGKIQEEST